MLAITQIGPQEPGGNVPVSYSIDKSDAGVAAVLYAATDPAPLAVDFNGAGAPAYADLGTMTLDTSGTPLDLALPDGLNGSYRLALLPSGDGDVAISAAVTIDTMVSTPDPMAGDGGVIYWYGADDTTRSGSNVTGIADKGGAAFALISIPAAFGAPQQSGAAAPILFSGATPTVIQTAGATAAQALLVNHVTSGAGAIRLFMVLDGESLGTSAGVFLAESADNGANNSFYFGCYRSGTGTISTYARARQFDDAFNRAHATSLPAASAGLFLYEVSLTLSTCQSFINGSLSPVSGYGTDLRL